jgi:hypothetical protein
MATQAQRNAIAGLLDFLLEHRGQVHYPPIVHGQIVRRETVHDIRTVAELKRRVRRTEGWTVDCSQCVTGVLLAAGCRNPNGFNTDGFTGTLLEHLPHYHDPRAAYIGALAVFGPGTGHHVAIVRHRDTHHGNPVMLSQGQESDPRMINLLTEAAYQPHPVTMLSIAHL